MVRTPLISPSETLRFCRAADEIPMSRIFDQTRIIISFSQMQLVREIPMPADQRLEIRALGLFDPATEGPVLPCALTISPEKGRKFGKTSLIRVGYLHDSSMHYRLEIRISDEEAEVARAVRDAFTAAAITRRDYLRIAFQTEPSNPVGKLQLLLNEGFCDGPDISGIVFGAGMTLGAPEWSWAWDSGDLDQPVFHDGSVARHRRSGKR